MNTGLISVRYAKALSEFSKSQKNLEKVYEEAKLLCRMFREMPQIHEVLENPFISKKEKRKLILNTVGTNPSQTFEKFTDLVIENEREKQIQEIFYKFIEIYREEHNIHYGRLTTAVPIDKDTEEKLKSLIQKEGKLELEHVINRDILGGFILEIDDVRWNASIAHQLKKIKQNYREKNRINA